MKYFKVGDVVLMTGSHDGRFFKTPGTVCNILPNDTYGVDFGTNVEGHDCAGTCPNRYGWNIHNSNLKLISNGDHTFDGLYELIERGQK